MHRLIVALTVVLCGLRPAGAVSLHDCKVGGAKARCGTVSVRENRKETQGRQIRLNVVLLPSTAAQPRRDAVVFMPGGPGEAATAAAPEFVSSPLRAERDILFVDMRGTGESNPLRCSYQDAPDRGASYLADFAPADGLRKCLTELQAKADLRLYTTPNAADDLEEVRVALGYDALNLIGASYGTRFSLAYMRQYPKSVRSAILYGPAPMNQAIPLSVALDAESALDSLLGDCDGDCLKRFPNVRQTLDDVLADLARNPRKVAVRDARSGKDVDVLINRTAFAQAIRYMLYGPSSAARIPLTIDLASRGDFSEVATFALALGTAFNGDPDGLYTAVTCTEDVAYVPVDTARALAGGTFLGTDRVDIQTLACSGWPKGDLPAGYREPVRSDVPTLIIVGERDPATPPRLARSVAANLTNGRVIVVRDGGHSLEGLQGAECLKTLEPQFIAKASIDVPAGCAATALHPPFAMKSEKESAVKLTAGELRQFAATYVAADGRTLVIELQGDVLTAAMGDAKLPLLPMSATEFAVEGAAGVRLLFDVAQDRVAAVTIVEGGGEGLRFERKGK